MVHRAYARRAVPHAARDAPRAGGVGGRRTAGRAACLVVSGLRRLAGEPRRYGQSRGCRHGDRRRRSGSRLLDVDHRPAGGFERFRRIDPRPALQTPRQGFLYRRSGLLYGTGTGPALDGRGLRRTDLRHVRLRLQFGAEQHDLRRMGGRFRLRPPLGRHRPDAADAGRYLRRHTPHRPRERGGGPGHGAGGISPLRWAWCSSISGGCPKSWS